MAKDIEFTAKIAADRSNPARKDEALKKLIEAWNSKNAQAAKRVGTFGFMAAALAACGGGSGGSVGNGDGSGDGDESDENSNSFGVTPVVSGATTVSGAFAFFDRDDAEITSVTADPEDVAGKLLEYVEESAPVDVTGLTTIDLAGGVTLVVTIEDLAQIQVAGTGNVWALVGTASSTTTDHGSFALDIDITGNLIFDMDGDERAGVEQKVAITGTIDLNFGDIIVSDGTVDLTGATLARIGKTVEINSTLIITYDQFVKALEAETSFAGVGDLVVSMGPTDGDLLEGYLAVSHLLGQVQLQDPATGPKSFILQESGATQSIEVSPQDIELTVSRFVDQAIALFEQRIQGFASSGEYTSLALILDDTDAPGNTSNEPTQNSIAGLKAAISSLNAGGNPELDALENEVGSPASVDGQGNAVAASGLYALIETSIDSAIEALEVSLSGYTRDATSGDLIIASDDFATIKDLSEAVNKLQDLAGLDELGSGANAVDFVTRLTALETTTSQAVETYVSGAISSFEAQIQGFASSGEYTSLALILDDTDAPGNTSNEPTQNSIAGLKAAISSLNAGGNPELDALENEVGSPASVDGQGNAVAASGLYALIETSIDSAIEALEDSLSGYARDGSTGNLIIGNDDFATIKDLSEAVNKLQDLAGLDELAVSGANATNFVTRLTALETTTSQAVETYVSGAITTLKEQIQGFASSTDYTSLAAILDDSASTQDGEPSLNSIAGLKAAIASINAGGNPDLDALEDEVGLKAEDNNGTATGLYALIETSIDSAVEALEDSLSGYARDGSTGNLIIGNDDFASIKDLSDAVSKLQALAGLDELAGSGADATDFVTRLTALETTTSQAVETYVSGAISSFEAQIQGFASSGEYTSLALILDDTDAPGNTSNEPTQNSIAGLKAAISSLNAGGNPELDALENEVGSPASVDGQGNAVAASGLYALIETSIDSAIEALEVSLSGYTRDATSGDLIIASDDFATIKDLSEAVNKLQDLAGLDELGSGANAVDFVTRLTALETTTSQAVETYVSGAITTLKEQIQGFASSTDYTSLAAILDDSASTQDGEPSLNSIAGLKAAIASINAGGNPDLDALEDEVGLKAEDNNGTATGLYALIETSIDSAVEALEDSLSGYARDGSTGNLIIGNDDFASIKDLSDAVSKLQALAGLDELAGSGADATDFVTRLTALETTTSQAVKTYVSGAISSFEAQIQGFASSGEYTSLALILDDTDAPGNTSNEPTQNSIAGLKAAISSLNAGGNPELDALENEVGSPASVDGQGNAVAASGLYALIEDLQAQINAVVAPDEIQGNELDNHIQMFAFAGQEQTIRVDGDEGNDTIDSADVDTHIIGGLGSDTINLTWKDGSSDTVIYQSIYEGQSIPVVSVTFSDDEQDYREGTVLSLTINGTAYSYTVTAYPGDSVQDALQGLVDELTAQSAPIEGGSVDPASGTIRLVGTGTLNVEAGDGTNPAIVNPGLAKQVSITFPNSSDWPTATNGTNTTEFVREMSVQINGDTPLVAQVQYDSDGSVDVAASLDALKDVIETTYGAGGTVTDGLLSLVQVSGSSITLVGADVGGETNANFTVDAATLDQNGTQQETTVSFSADDADYYAGGTLSVVVAGETIEADMVAGDAVASVTNLQMAVQAAQLPISATSSIGVDTAALGGTLSETTAFDGSSTKLKILVDGELWEPNQSTLTGPITFDFTHVTNISWNGSAWISDSGSPLIDKTVTGTVRAINSQSFDELRFNGTVGYGEYFKDFPLQNDMVDLDNVSDTSNVSGIYPNSFNHFQGVWTDGSVTGMIIRSDSSGSYKLVTDGATGITPGADITANWTGENYSDPSVVPNIGTDGDGDPQLENGVTLASLIDSFNTKFDGKATMSFDTGLQTLIIEADEAGSSISIEVDQFDFQVGGNSVLDVANATVTLGEDAQLPIVESVKVVTSDEKETVVSVVQSTDTVSFDLTGVDATEEFFVKFVPFQEFKISGSAYQSNGDGTLDTTSQPGLFSWSLTETFVNGLATSIRPELVRVDGTDYFKFASVGDFVAALNEFTDPTSWSLGHGRPELSFTASYNADSQAIEVVATGDSIAYSGDALTGLGQNRLDYMFTVTSPDLIITANTEEPDPLNVTASMDYAGTKQEATFSLDTATQYSEYSFDIHVNGVGTADTPTRAADVYFEGGKVYLKIADLVSGSDTLVSVDMSESISTVFYYSKTTGAVLATDTFSNSPFSVSFVGGGNVSVFTSGKNVVQILAELESDPRIKSAEIVADGADAGKIRIEAAPGIEISTTNLVGNPTFSFTGGGQIAFDRSTASVDASVATSRALVEEINAEAASGGSLHGLIESASYDSASGEITLTAAQAGKETFAISDVTLDYQGVQQKATFKLEADADNVYDANTDGDTITRGAEIFYEGGKAHLTITDLESDADTLVSVDMVASPTLSVEVGTTGLTSSHVFTDSPTQLETTGNFFAFILLKSNGMVYSDGSTSNEVGSLFVTQANETVDQFLSRITQDPYIDSASFNETDGKIKIQLSSQAYDEGVAKIFVEAEDSANNNFFAYYYPTATPQTDFAAMTRQALVDEINAQASSGSLDGLIESATFDSATGEITLTAKEAGEETFAISDVTLDYEGIKQISTISLLDSPTHSMTYADGASYDLSPTSRGAEAYYDGGKVYLAIEKADDGTVVNIEAPMVVEGLTLLFKAGRTPSPLEDASAGIGFNSTSAFVISLTIDGISYDETDFVKYLTDNAKVLVDFDTVSDLQDLPTNSATTQDLADWIESLAEVVSTEVTTNDQMKVVFAPDVELVDWFVTSAAYTNGTLVLEGPDALGSYFFTEDGKKMNEPDVIPPADPREPTAQALVDAIEAEMASGGLEGVIGSVSRDGMTITLESAVAAPEVFKVSNVTLDYQGREQIATAEFSTDNNDYYTGGEVSLTIDPTPSDSNDTGSDLSVTLTMSAGDADATLNALVDEINSKIANETAWSDVLQLASLDTSTGVLTLTSADKVEEQFLISAATITEQSTAQQASAMFSALNDHYYDGGKIGLTINGEPVEVAMVARDAVATLNALKAAVEQKIAATTALSDKLEGTVELDFPADIGTDGVSASLIFTAKAAEDGFGEIDITEVFTGVEAQAQISTLQLTDGAVPLAIAEVEDQPQLWVDIDGTKVYADAGNTEAESVRNLAQAVIDARDGVYDTIDVAAAGGDVPAQVRIALPDDVTAGTILANDGTNTLSTVLAEIVISDGTDDATVVLNWSDATGFGGDGRATVAELVDALNNGLSDPTLGTITYDAARNEIVVTSTASGSDASITVKDFALANFYQADGTIVEVAGEPVAISLADQALSEGASADPAVLNLTDTSSFTWSNSISAGLNYFIKIQVEDTYTGTTTVIEETFMFTGDVDYGTVNPDWPVQLDALLSPYGVRVATDSNGDYITSNFTLETEAEGQGVTLSVQSFTTAAMSDISLTAVNGASTTTGIQAGDDIGFDSIGDFQVAFSVTDNNNVVYEFFVKGDPSGANVQETITVYKNGSVETVDFSGITTPTALPSSEWDYTSAVEFVSDWVDATEQALGVENLVSISSPVGFGYQKFIRIEVEDAKSLSPKAPNISTSNDRFVEYKFSDSVASDRTAFYGLDSNDDVILGSVGGAHPFFNYLDYPTATGDRVPNLASAEIPLGDDVDLTNMVAAGSTVVVDVDFSANDGTASIFNFRLDYEVDRPVSFAELAQELNARLTEWENGTTGNANNTTDGGKSSGDLGTISFDAAAEKFVVATIEASDARDLQLHEFTIPQVISGNLLEITDGNSASLELGQFDELTATPADGDVLRIDIDPALSTVVEDVLELSDATVVFTLGLTFDKDGTSLGISAQFSLSSSGETVLRISDNNNNLFEATEDTEPTIVMAASSLEDVISMLNSWLGEYETLNNSAVGELGEILFEDGRLIVETAEGVKVSAGSSVTSGELLLVSAADTGGTSHVVKLKDDNTFVENSSSSSAISTFDVSADIGSYITTEGPQGLIFDGGVDGLAADTLLASDTITGTLTVTEGGTDTELAIAFTPALAEKPGQGGTVQDFVDYLNSDATLSQHVQAALVDGDVVISAISTTASLGGDLTLGLKGTDFAETIIANAAASDQGTAEVAFEAATPAELAIAFSNAHIPTFEGYSITLGLDIGDANGLQPITATAQSGFSGDIDAVVTALNATGSPFEGRVSFAWDGTDGALVATSVATGAQVQIDFDNAVLVEDASSFNFRVGQAVEDPVFGVDEVAFEAATGASITLSEFQGVDPDASLAEGQYDFSIVVDGTPITGSYTAPDPTTSPGTVTDYIAAINNALGSDASAALTDAGLEIVTSADGSSASLEVSASDLSISVIQAPVQAIASVVGSVEFNADSGDNELTLTGANDGPDEMNLGGYTYETEDAAAGSAQQVEVAFTNTLDSASSVPAGTVISLTIDGVETQLKLWSDAAFTDDTSGYSGTYFDLSSVSGDRSEAIVAALADAIEASHNLGDATSGTDTDLMSVAVAGNRIELESARNGSGTLGTVDDGRLGLTVTAPTGAGGADQAIAVGFVETLNAGEIVYVSESTHSSTDVTIQTDQVGRDEGVLTFTDNVDGTSGEGTGVTDVDDYDFTVDGSDYDGAIDDLDGRIDINDTLTEGKETKTVGVTRDNPDDEPDYAGDSPLTGGFGIKQDYENPDDSVTDLQYSSTGGDANFYGDDALIGEDDQGDPTGLGVKQTYTNPTDGYDALDASPQDNTVGNTNTGDKDLYGDDAQIGEIDGNGDFNGEGVTQTYTNPEDGYDAESGSPRENDADTNEGDADLFGGAAGVITDDGTYTDNLEGSTTMPERFVYALPSGILGSSEVTAGTVSVSNGTETETITFGTQTDLTELVDGVVSASFVDTVEITQDGEIIITTTGASGDYLELALDLTFSDNTTVTDTARAYGETAISLSDDDADGGVSGESATELADDADNGDDFEITDDKDPFAPFSDDATVTSVAGGNAEPDVVNNFQIANDFIAAEGELALSTWGNDGTLELLEAGDTQIAFDLSETEFGLVGSGESTLNASEIKSAADVAGLLAAVFEFNAASGGTTDSGVINSTLFAVTASDDDSVTAIWAHQQASSDDATVDELELNLLAVVNTRDGEFTAENFAIWDATSEQFEILQPSQPV